jgi:hypothetical protein
MAVTDQAAARVATYVEQLLDDDQVRKHIRRAADATRRAYLRARGKEAPKVLKDRKVQRRVQEAMQAAGEAVNRLARGPQKRKRARRGRALAGLAIGAGGLALALNPEVRSKALALLGGEDGAAPDTTPPPAGEGGTTN